MIFSCDTYYFCCQNCCLVFEIMSRTEKDKLKQIQDRCQALLTEMLRDDDNKYCVDCDAKGPRWASWNLGIFLCIRCAGIHRNLGVHISKVKSVNLDTWTPEQVVSLQQMGNSRARAVYEANLPDNFRRPQTDSSLEAFVRAKYEQKKYIAREWVPPSIPKVNWDKELDEEAERQRRRKKELNQQRQVRRSNNSASETTVPQLLPKPKGSTSPKVPRTTADAGKTAPKSATHDLLGLESPEGSTATPVSSSVSAGGGDDIFSSFLSAPPATEPVSPAGNTKPVEKPEEPVKGRSAEEESFFNQPAPSSAEKRQLTKDSILALYATQPTQPVSQQPMFGIPGGLYTQPSSGFPTAAPGLSYGISNNMLGAQPIQNGVYAVPGLGSQPLAATVPVSGIASNPFFNMGTPAAAFPVMTQESASSNTNQDLMLDFGAMISNVQSSSASQLPQQFVNLNIGAPIEPPQPQGYAGLQGVTRPVGRQVLGRGMPDSIDELIMGPVQQPANPGHTLATNLWQ
uniref:Arf-GAP domain-containing protein n=1 Tax=Timema poppense TaxID=170557 RepID=A0A7R9CZE5_TIMPO|nr:unnamed protein product [Timema poppensis]